MNWKENGVKIVHARELDLNTPQTSGMTRAAVIAHAPERTNYGRARWWCNLMPRPDHGTTPSWRPFSTL